jgi:hypothetical protein
VVAGGGRSRCKARVCDRGVPISFPHRPSPQDLSLVSPVEIAQNTRRPSRIVLTPDEWGNLRSWYWKEIDDKHSAEDATKAAVGISYFVAGLTGLLAVLSLVYHKPVFGMDGGSLVDAGFLR